LVNFAMATIAKSFGYSRRNSVPDLSGTKIKSCKVCRKWFAAYPYEQTCDGCVKPRDLTKRAISRKGSGSTQTRQSQPKRAGQKVVKQGSMALCRELAWELAAQDVSPEIVARSNRGPTMSKKEAFTLTQRNVNHGVQGACDLERYR
jgi:hypothetical protein